MAEPFLMILAQEKGDFTSPWVLNFSTHPLPHPEYRLMKHLFYSTGSIDIPAPFF